METTNTMAATELERLARLEVLVEGLTRDQEQAARDRHETNKKLDELLALRHKGVSLLAGVVSRRDLYRWHRHHAYRLAEELTYAWKRSEEGH